MPIYEYQCESCGQRSEVMQRLSDAPLEICEECSGKLRKLISAPAFQFKGSGWYVTDYARKGGDKDRSESKSDTKEDSKSSGSDSGSDSGSGSGDSGSSSSSKSSDSKKGSGD